MQGVARGLDRAFRLIEVHDLDVHFRFLLLLQGHFLVDALGAVGAPVLLIPFSTHVSTVISNRPSSA